MYQRIISYCCTGLEAHRVLVEADIHSGLPCLNLLGLAETSGRDVRERLRSAFSSIGYQLPARKITVNLVWDTKGKPPLQKIPGDGLDLPIALAILCADRFLPSALNDSVAVIGDLSLNGALRPVPWAARIASACKASGLSEDPPGQITLLMPEGNRLHASFLSGVELLSASSLTQVVSFWRGQEKLEALKTCFPAYARPPLDPLMVIRGQAGGKRALAVACAGFHNLLLCGPPGCGKTLLAHAASGLLPPPEGALLDRILLMDHTLEEPQDPLQPFYSRPVRTPHHSLTTHALIGGGRPVRPGELSLADGGLLILDEMAEFSGQVLENLRQPLENHRISLNYLGESREFPADFMLIGTANLCPCGFFPDTEKCRCRPSAIHRYQSRLGGPLLDRIDICLNLNAVPAEEHTTLSRRECLQLRDNILEASDRQKRRYQNEEFKVNSRIPPDRLRQYCALSPETEAVFITASRRFELSLRRQHMILKTARSIADLAGSDRILTGHLAEALSYRPHLHHD